MRKSGSVLLLEIILSLTISALIMTMNGCGSADEKEKGSRAAVNEEDGATTKEDTEPYESKAETETSETVEDTDVTETEVDTETEAGESSATEPNRNETETDTQTSAEPVTEKHYVSETEATTPAPTEVPTPAPTQPPTEAPTQSPTEAPTEADTRPTYDYMSESYLAEAEAYLVQYINEYRVAEGNVALQLSNCSKAYVKGRSVQIMTNFAHDVKDERALAAELKYGEYIDTEAYGMDGPPFYEPWGREAIGKVAVGEHTSPEKLARNLADGFHRSQSHWNYVGSVTEQSKRYKYVSVGITCEGYIAYCCVSVLDESHD